MSVIDNLKELLVGAESKHDTGELPALCIKSCRTCRAQSKLQSGGLLIAQALVESQEALEAWQAVDEHECGPCDSHGYGECLDSQDIIFRATFLQRDALRLTGLKEAMK